MPTPSAEYESLTLEASEGLPRYQRWIIASFDGAIGGRTLEFGAGLGTMSRHLRSLSSELVLIEPAVNLCTSLAERFRDDPSVTVRCGLLEEVAANEPELFAGGFDSIVSFNVLEHIPDDVAVIRVAATLLRPGGRLCVFVPSCPRLYGALDAQVNHVRRYTKATLGEALRSAGLRPMRLRYLDLLGMIPWFVLGRVLRRTSKGVGASWYDRLVIPVCRVADRLTGPPIGKNLLAVAEVSG